MCDSFPTADVTDAPQSAGRATALLIGLAVVLLAAVAAAITAIL